MTQFSMHPIESKAVRLFQIREKLGFNQREFTEKLGIAQNNLSNLEKGKRPIGKNISKNVLTTFNVNPVWWETGEGEMFLSGITAKPKTTEPAENYIAGPRSVITYIPEDLVKVPLLDINARAGFIENLDNYTEYLTEHTSVLPHKGERYENALAMRVDGDSMEPQLMRGDVVLTFFQEKSEWEYLNPGVYAIIYRSSFVISGISHKQSAQLLKVSAAAVTNFLYSEQFRPELLQKLKEGLGFSLPATYNARNAVFLHSNQKTADFGGQYFDLGQIGAEWDLKKTIVVQIESDDLAPAIPVGAKVLAVLVKKEEYENVKGPSVLHIGEDLALVRSFEAIDIPEGDIKALYKIVLSLVSIQ